MNIWMIVVSNDAKSKYYSSLCIDQWNKLGYNITKKEGTTPSTLGNQILFADKKFNGNKFTDIEKAIWYSHYNLWRHIEEPTYIIEHDTYPYKELPEFNELIGFFSTFPRNDDAWRKKRETISPGSGYFVNRTSASILRDWAVSATVTENVDGFLYQTAKKLLNQSEEEFESNQLKFASCFQLVNYEVGTSAEHNV